MAARDRDARELSRQNEPTGEPNSQFVWYFARQVFFSEIPTGTADDEPEGLPATG